MDAAALDALSASATAAVNLSYANVEASSQLLSGSAGHLVTAMYSIGDAAAASQEAAVRVSLAHSLVLTCGLIAWYQCSRLNAYLAGTCQLIHLDFLNLQDSFRAMICRYLFKHLNFRTLHPWLPWLQDNLHGYHQCKAGSTDLMGLGSVHSFVCTSPHNRLLHTVTAKDGG